MRSMTRTSIHAKRWGTRTISLAALLAIVGMLSGFFACTSDSRSYINCDEFVIVTVDGQYGIVSRAHDYGDSTKLTYLTVKINDILNKSFTVLDTLPGHTWAVWDAGCGKFGFLGGDSDRPAEQLVVHSFEQSSSTEVLIDLTDQPDSLYWLYPGVCGLYFEDSLLLTEDTMSVFVLKMTPEGRIDTLEIIGNVMFPVFSDDGKQVIMESRASSADSLYSLLVYDIPHDSSYILCSSDAEMYCQRRLNTESPVYYSRYERSSQSHNLFSYDETTGEETQLTHYSDPIILRWYWLLQDSIVCRLVQSGESRLVNRHEVIKLGLQ